MDLVFATNNQNKLQEIKALISPHINLLTLADIGCVEELPETQLTLEGNALQKAKYVFDQYKVNCFADDTGLEIEALNGRPGVFSARYAGEEKSADRNMRKVLSEMKGVKNRTAYFKTVISLIINNKEVLFKGIVNGIILERKRGKKGFGYDPIFVPEGYQISFAEMSLDEKNKISHRAMAVKKLVDYLNFTLK